MENETKSCASGTFSLRHGVSALQGRRPYMEDRHIICLDAVITMAEELKSKNLGETNERHSFFGVFDGHGGQLASSFVADNIHKQLVGSTHYPQSPIHAFEDACDITDQMYRETHQFAAAQDGTTACMVLVIGNRIYTANVGDSRAVLCRSGKALPLSTDHKPDKDSERKRIEDAGGIVKKGSFFNIPMGPFRVYLGDGVRGGLAVSRAIGDTFYKDSGKPKEQWLISNIPEIFETTLSPDSDEFFVIASDGFWDVFTNENAVTAVKQLFGQGRTPEEISHELTDRAFSRDSLDNITVIIVKIEPLGGSQGEKKDEETKHVDTPEPATAEVKTEAEVHPQEPPTEPTPAAMEEEKKE